MKKSKGNFAVLLVILFVIYNSYNNFNNKPKHYTSEPSTVQTTKTTTSSTNSIDQYVDKLKKSTKKIRNDWKTSKTKAELEEKVSKYLNKFKNNTNNQSKQNVQNQTDSELANLEPEGRDSVEVNGNKSSLDFSNWTTEHIEYSPLDNLNRAGKATAYLSKINYGKSEGRESQTWRPTGWLNNQQKNKDRGHLIAYTLSFNFDEDGNLREGELGSIDNPKNLFTQTSHCNREIMTQYEQMVRDTIRQNKRVIYQVTPVFRGDELMARGVHIQAISEDGSLNFNQYLFNVDEHYNFDYATGRSWRK